jgi:hypothetical protein
MFPEYESIASFAQFLREEECDVAEWAELGAFVDARSSELAEQARSLLASVARRPESIRDDLPQTEIYLRRKACAEVVRALRALGFKMACRRKGDWSPEVFQQSQQSQEIEMSKATSFNALVSMIAGQAFGSAVPDGIKGRLQAYKRDGVPGKPEDGKSYAQKLILAAVAVADAGETSAARKLVDQAMVTLSEIVEAPKVEAPAETPAEQ